MKKTFSRIEWKFVMFCRSFSADSWKVHHRVQMDLLRKNIYVFPKHNRLQLFSVVERKFWDKKNKQHRQICDFICLENLLVRKILSWKNEQFGYFFFNFENVFLQFVEKIRTFDKNVLAWLKKMDSLPRQGFFQGKLYLFWWEIVFSSFSHLGWVLFGLWQKNFNRFSKLCFYLSRVTSSGEILFFRKKNSLINFHYSSGVYIRCLVKKKDFRLENIGTVLETGLYASGETFWGKLCSPKKISWKYFLYFNQIFVFFCRICSACLSKLRPCFQMNDLRKIFFFRTKSFSRVIFRTEAENCRTLHWIFNRKSKVPFKCLEELFRETFVLGKNINRSINCLRSWREFFSEIWEKSSVWQKGISTVAKTGFYASKVF